MKVCKHCGTNILNKRSVFFCNRACYIAWIAAAKTNNGMYGKHHTDSTKLKISLKSKGNQYWLGRKHSEETIKKFKLIDKTGSGFHFRSKSGSFKGCNNPMFGRKQSELCKQINRERQKIKNSFILIKNKLEEDFENILEENFPNKWKYAGTGEFPVGYKYPDFINEEDKKIIEVFGNYWHRNDTGEARISHFKQYGYSTLIIWEKEIREDLLSVLEKVSIY